MRLLIDTHVLIWWWDERERLSDLASHLLADRNNMILVSAAIAWELALKERKGQLPRMTDKLHAFDASIADDGFQHLPIRADHAIRSGLFTGKHKDPFDRVIAAQALIEDLTVVTRDHEIAAFGCQVLW